MSTALESLYMTLLLGNRTVGLPFKYKTPIYTPPSDTYDQHYLREDMDFVPGSIAENSSVWNLPEEAPEALARLGNEQIATLDAYRQNRGKPKIKLTKEEYDQINCNAGWEERKPKLPPTYL